MEQGIPEELFEVVERKALCTTGRLKQFQLNEKPSASLSGTDLFIASACYCFSQVTLRNEGMQEPVQLINRHWVITDFDGRTQQVISRLLSSDF